MVLVGDLVNKGLHHYQVNCSSLPEDHTPLLPQTLIDCVPLDVAVGTNMMTDWVPNILQNCSLCLTRWWGLHDPFILQVVKLVQKIGAITVRGNHDEVALERYQSWRLTGTLDVSQNKPFELLHRPSY